MLFLLSDPLYPKVVRSRAYDYCVVIQLLLLVSLDFPEFVLDITKVEEPRLEYDVLCVVCLCILCWHDR